MSFTSEISDFISRIKVAQVSKDVTVKLRLSKVTVELSTVLKRLGFIQSFCILNSNCLIFRLKYKNSRPLIREIKTVSTPGRRVYWNRQVLAMNTNRHSLGCVYILSTPLGLRTSTECLTTSVTGGEVLLQVTVN